MRVTYDRYKSSSGVIQCQTAKCQVKNRSLSIKLLPCKVSAFVQQNDQYSPLSFFFMHAAADYYWSIAVNEWRREMQTKTWTHPDSIRKIRSSESMHRNQPDRWKRPEHEQKMCSGGTNEDQWTGFVLPQDVQDGDCLQVNLLTSNPNILYTLFSGSIRQISLVDSFWSQ